MALRDIDMEVAKWAGALGFPARSGNLPKLGEVEM